MLGNDFRTVLTNAERDVTVQSLGDEVHLTVIATTSFPGSSPGSKREDPGNEVEIAIKRMIWGHNELVTARAIEILRNKLLTF